jgi:predicted transcriptional regulator
MVSEKHLNSLKSKAALAALAARIRMSATTIKTAIAAVEEKGIETDLELYDVVDKQPGESVYSLAKAMGWSTGKTYAAARRLERSGMVHIQKTVRNGREVLTIKPKTWEEYYTPEELAEMRQPGFMDEVEAIVKKAHF